jgi:hypothetical protein
LYFKNGIPYLVIDVINNKPLRDFSHIPITVSSNVEGWLQEAWFRQDPSLQAEDLIQRMPYKPADNVYKDRKILNRLVRRRELFRDTGRCLSWIKTVWTKKWDLFLISEMNDKPSLTDPNSTRHLKDLRPDEKNALKDLTYKNKTYLAKGSKYTLVGEKRVQKDLDVKERLESHTAKKIKKALDKQVDNADALEDHAKSQKANSTKKTSRQSRTQSRGNVYGTAAANTTAPPRYGTSIPVADRSGAMSHPGPGNGYQMRMAGDLGINPEGSQLRQGRYEHHGMGSAPQFQINPITFFVEDMPDAQDESYATDQLQDMQDMPNMQNIQTNQGIQQANQQRMNPAHLHSMGGGVPGLVPFHGQHQHMGYVNGYGNWPGLPNGTASPFTAPPQAHFQSHTTAVGRYLPCGDVSSHMYRASVQRNGSSNGGFVRSQPYLINPQTQHGYFTPTRGQWQSQHDAGLGHDLNSGEVMCASPTCDNPGQCGLAHALRSDLTHQQQHDTRRHSYADHRHHGYTHHNSSIQANGNNAYYPVDPTNNNNRGEPSSSGYGMGRIVETGERLDNSRARASITAGLERPSSRKRRAEPEFDDDLVDPAVKSRRLN